MAENGTTILTSFTKTAAICGLLALAIGLTGLCGWLFDNKLLTTFLSDGATMKMNTALLILFGGGSVYLQNEHKTAAARILAAIVTLLSLTIIAEYIFAANLHIDEILIKDLSTNPLKEVPGRTSLITAVCAFITGIALWSLSSKQLRLAQLLGAVVFTIVYISLIGHLFQITGFYQFGKYSGVAFHTSLGLLAIAIGLLITDWQHGWIGLLYGRLSNLRSRLLFLIYVLGVAPLMAAVYLFVIKESSLSPASDVVILILVTLILILPIAYFLVKTVGTLGQELSESDARLRIALDAAQLGVWQINANTKALVYNPILAEIFGYEGATPMTYDQAIGQVTERFREQIVNEIAAAIATGSNYDLTYQQKRFNDGAIIWLRSFGKVSADEHGLFTIFSGVVMDITDKIRQQEHLQQLNEEMAATVEELRVTNEELVTSNNERQILLEGYEAVNEEMSSSNEELASTNEELTSTNEELIEIQRRLETEKWEKERAIDHIKANEENIRNIVLQSPVGMCILIGDPLVVLEVNDTFLQIIGKNRDVIKSLPYWEVIPEAAPKYKPITDEVMATGTTYQANEHAIPLVRDGIEQLVHVDFVYEPMKDGEGNTYGIMIVAIDVTDKVLARKKVERAEESLRMAIEAAGLGSYYINVIDRIFYPSAKLKEFFGFGPGEEVPYEAAINQIHEDYRQAAAELVEAAITTGVTFDMEYPIVGHNDGKIRWVRGIGTVQQDDEGVNRYFTGVLHEITEQKQDELRKNDFIGMVSHELKTPLTSLTALIQVSNNKLKHSDDVFLSGAMDKANIQVKRMTRMINGFLNISRLESGKILIDKHVFDLEALIEEMIRETRITISSHIIHFEPCEPVMINADSDKIGSVITNLISNAVKYSPKGKLIEIKCDVLDGNAQVSVKDEGMGIKPADRENLFERYYRVESEHTQHISGFGIGLYLSAEIIQRHNGKIWVESESGVGSTFYFSLPIQSTNEKEK